MESILLAGVIIVFAGMTAVSFFLPRAVGMILVMLYCCLYQIESFWIAAIIGGMIIAAAIDVLLSGMNPIVQNAAQEYEREVVMTGDDFKQYLREGAEYFLTFKAKAPFVRQIACLIGLVAGSVIFVPRLLFVAGMCHFCFSQLHFSLWLIAPIGLALATSAAYFDIFACCCLKAAYDYRQICKA